MTPVHTISPTPKLVTDEQTPLVQAPWPTPCTSSAASSACRCFHPEYDTVAVGRTVCQKGDMAAAPGPSCTMTCSTTSTRSPSERPLRRSSAISPRLARRAHAGPRRRHRGARRPSGRLACVPPLYQPAHRRVRRQLREPHALRPRGRARHPRRCSPDICIDYKLPIITENPQLGRGGLFIDEAVWNSPNCSRPTASTPSMSVRPTTPAISIPDTIPAYGHAPQKSAPWHPTPAVSRRPCPCRSPRWDAS